MNFRGLFFFIVVCFLTSCATQRATGYGTITGTITHQENGKPYYNIKVSVDAPQHSGRHPTNVFGSYELDKVAVGKWTVEFYCPSTNYVGRKIARKPITIKANKIVNLDLKVPPDFCFEPAYSERKAKYIGYIYHNFEYSGFSPCNAELLKLSKNTFTAPAFIWAELSADQMKDIKTNTLYFVELVGALKGPGSYGHLGLAYYVLEIEQIKQHFGVREENCEKHTFNDS